MLTTTVEEVEAAFAEAKNLNSALKKFLKRESQGNASVERFAKDFREAVSSGSDPAIKLFIQRNFPKHETYFLALVRYAYPELFATTIAKIHEAHADEFNMSYEPLDDGIRVTDESKFSSVVKQVHIAIEAALKENGLPASNFMKKSFLLGIFEPKVVRRVLEIE